MNEHDKIRLRERLLELSARPLGLCINTQTHWMVTGIKDPRQFLAQLHLLMDEKSTVYIESISTHPEAASFYAKNETDVVTPVACGTVFPIPDVYHLRFSEDLVVGLSNLIHRHRIRELFTHIGGYRSQQMTFSFHDAFEGDLLISAYVPEDIVGGVCKALGVSYSQEPTKLNSNPYRDLLYALDNPQKIKFQRGAWWQELIKGFLSGFRNQ